MENISPSQLQRGVFLIASPDFSTGIFFRSVVLLCEHSDKGSFGLVVNKRLEVEISEEIVDTQQMANPHIAVRSGGPVQTNKLMLLHNSPTVPQQSMETCKGVYLGGDLQFLQEVMSDENGPYVHLCFGYAGWGAGQLENEFLDGRWFLSPASEKHLFHIEPEKLWQQLLREMGGKYAALSMIPEDLTLN